MKATATAATVAAYQRFAVDYARRVPDLHPAMAALLDAFVAELPPRALVLEIGSASGRDADELEHRGVRVHRTDITPAFVELLRASGQDAHVVDPAVDDLGGPYDGAFASATLLHVPRAELGGALLRLRAAVRLGGVLCLTMKEGDGEGWSHHGGVDAPRHFTWWRADALRTVLLGAGWHVDTLGLLPGRAELDERWLHVLASAR